jgi:transcriptional regulator with XRE-family HTH domain
MLSETLANGLNGYRIGPKIRELRRKRELGLAQLGKHTSLSTGTLSKIERGQLVPTLPTLLRIALVFGVGLDYFFTESFDRPAVAVVRKKDRVRLPEKPGDAPPSFFFECLDYPASNRRMEAYYAEFEPAERAAPSAHEHSGAEFIYVLRGQLAVAIAGDETLLAEGDSMYFDSGHPHLYRRYGRGPCSAIVVVVRGREPA